MDWGTLEDELLQASSTQTPLTRGPQRSGSFVTPPERMIQGEKSPASQNPSVRPRPLTSLFQNMGKAKEPESAQEEPKKETTDKNEKGQGAEQKMGKGEEKKKTLKADEKKTGQDEANEKKKTAKAAKKTGQDEAKGDCADLQKQGLQDEVQQKLQKIISMKKPAAAKGQAKKKAKAKPKTKAVKRKATSALKRPCAKEVKVVKELEEETKGDQEAGEEEAAEQDEVVDAPDAVVPKFPGADLKLKGKIMEQKKEFCQKAQAFFIDQGYERAEAYKHATASWMESAQRSAAIGAMSESEQVRRRFREPFYKQQEGGQ